MLQTYNAQKFKLNYPYLSFAFKSALLSSGSCTCRTWEMLDARSFYGSCPCSWSRERPSMHQFSSEIGHLGCHQVSMVWVFSSKSLVVHAKRIFFCGYSLSRNENSIRSDSHRAVDLSQGCDCSLCYLHRRTVDRLPILARTLWRAEDCHDLP